MSLSTDPCYLQLLAERDKLLATCLPLVHPVCVSYAVQSKDFYIALSPNARQAAKAGAPDSKPEDERKKPVAWRASQTGSQLPAEEGDTLEPTQVGTSW